MNNHAFCRNLLRQVMKDVRNYVSVEDRKKSYAWKVRSFKDTVEFHGPNDFYWHGSGCCLWYARYEGWTAYLIKLAREGNKDLQEYL